MEPTDLSAEAKARIAALLSAEGLDASYRAFVARHLTEPDATWRWCCGSSCDPCVTRLGRVVDGARAALAIGPEGLPEGPRDK